MCADVWIFRARDKKKTLGNSHYSKIHQYSLQGNVNEEKLELTSDKHQKCEIH